MEIKKRMRDYVYKSIQYRRTIRISRSDIGEKNYAQHLNLQQLNSDEKDQIKLKWGKIIPNIKDGYLAFSIYKTLHGFDPNYVPVPYFYPYLMWNLNSKEMSVALSHKGMLPKYFHTIPQPQMVINCINGTIFDDKYNIISFDEASKIVGEYNQDLIIKPSVDTSSGKNVKVIRQNGYLKDVKNLLHSYGDNYVVQQILQQSPSTKCFNPTSLQTIRINTLFINGKCSVVKTVMRCGGKDSIVDNLNAGGFMVGVESNGELRATGYSLDGKFHKQANGCVLGGAILPSFPKMILMAQKAHMHIPTASLVGWDFALDQYNNPILIEANMKFPSCLGSQMCGLPFFGDRTDEVIDYVKEKKSEIKTRLFY